jgi:protein CpxP
VLMKKNVLLYILLGFLVLMNGFFLYKHFSKFWQYETQQRPGSSMFISKQLDFDAAQMQQFENAEVAHREKMRSILDNLRESKEALFKKLSDEKVDFTEIDSLATFIAEKQKEKEMETFRFFREVTELCNDAQKERFISIIREAMRNQGPEDRKGRPPRGGPDDKG